MSSYTQILYQIVFSTKEREHTLTGNRAQLYKYIWGVFQKKNCHLYRIGGVEDHLHVVCHIHPTIALAQLVKDIKLSTSQFIKYEGMFTMFNGWQDGYGAFTYQIAAKENLIEYVKCQEEHHRRVSFKEEYLELLKEHRVEFDESFLL